MRRWQIGVLLASASTLAVALVLLAAALTPRIQAPDRPRAHPVPRPTSSTAPAHPAVDKDSLIIQQNVNCWYPVPGYICTGREYQ